MIREPITFGFVAEYPGDGAVYDEFEKYLRIEFEKRQSSWDPSFGRVSRLEPARHTWNYKFVLMGDVPDAASQSDAEQKVRSFVKGLGTGMRLAHANPGNQLPEPEIRVWKWELVPARS